jgi:hypothetical protein
MRHRSGTEVKLQSRRAVQCRTLRRGEGVYSGALSTQALKFRARVVRRCEPYVPRWFAEQARRKSSVHALRNPTRRNRVFERYQFTSERSMEATAMRRPRKLEQVGGWQVGPRVEGCCVQGKCRGTSRGVRGARGKICVQAVTKEICRWSRAPPWKVLKMPLRSEALSEDGAALEEKVPARGDVMRLSSLTRWAPRRRRDRALRVTFF